MWFRSKWNIEMWNCGMDIIVIIYKCGGEPPIYTLQPSAIIHDVISNREVKDITLLYEQIICCKCAVLLVHTNFPLVLTADLLV